MKKQTLPREFLAWQKASSNVELVKHKEKVLAGHAQRLGIPTHELHDRWVEIFRLRMEAAQ